MFFFFYIRHFWIIFYMYLTHIIIQFSLFWILYFCVK